MTESEDRKYYMLRAQQERESAERTEDTAARRVHQAMADRYQQLAAVAEMQPPSAI